MGNLVPHLERPVSPLTSYVGLTGVLLRHLDRKDWVPVTDLTYISYERLSRDWMLDELCPVAPELAIEIISPGQNLQDLVEKAVAYLKAGVDRVWLIDTQQRKITIFYSDALPQTFTGTMTIADEILPQLELSPQQIFKQAGLT